MMNENNASASRKDMFRFVGNDAIKSEKIVAPRYSYWKSVFRVFFRKKSNWVLLSLLAFILLASFIAPFFCPYDANENITASHSFNLSPAEAFKYFGGFFFAVYRKNLANKNRLSVFKSACSFFVTNIVSIIHTYIIEL